MRIRTWILVGLCGLGYSVPSFADPVRVVGQSLSARQAVLLDEETGEYRMVRIGDELNGARIVGIGNENVVLIRGGTQEEIKLAADPRPRPTVVMEPMVIHIQPMNVPTATAAAPVVAAAPVIAAAPVAAAPVAAAPVIAAAPVAAAPAAAPRPPAFTPMVVEPSSPGAPVVVAAPPIGSPPIQLSLPHSSTVVVQPPLPVAAPAPVVAAPVVVAAPRVVAPPIVVAAPPVVAPPVVVAAPPVVAPPAAVLTAPAPMLTPPPAPIAAPAPIAPAVASAPTAASAVTQIPRGELEAGLGNFQTLDASVAIEVAPQGGFRVADLKQGSFLHRMGLRQGDVILRVDGRALRNAQDASAAYNWVRVADHFVVDLVRDGRPVTLRFVVA